MLKTRVKIFISNKGVLLEQRINEELERLEEEGYFIRHIDTDISFAGSTGYQTMATIVYEEYIADDLDVDNSLFSIDSGELMASI